MPEPLTFWTALKGLLGPISSIGKEVIKRFNQPKLACRMPLTMGEHKLAGDIATEEGLRRGYRVEDEISWQYELTITNNTLHTAYNIRVVEPQSSHLAEVVDYTLPLEGHKSVTYRFNIVEALENVEEAGLIQFEHCPLEEVRIEYKNAKGSCFFTLFRPNVFEVENRNEYGRAVT